MDKEARQKLATLCSNPQVMYHGRDWQDVIAAEINECWHLAQLQLKEERQIQIQKNIMRNDAYEHISNGAIVAGSYSDSGKLLNAYEISIRDAKTEYTAALNAAKDKYDKQKEKLAKKEVEKAVEETIKPCNTYEEDKAAWLEILKAQKEKTTNKDLFGRNKSTPKILNLKKDNSIVIEVGNTPEDTIIRTVSGEKIPMATALAINMSADDGIITATITFLNPKIVERKEKANDDTRDSTSR